MPLVDQICPDFLGFFIFYQESGMNNCHYSVVASFVPLVDQIDWDIFALILAIVRNE